MIHISELLKKKEPPIKVIPKKDVISYISQMVTFSPDKLTNWRIVAKRLKPASPMDATKIYLSIKGGTYEDSTDYKGAFLYMIKKLPKIVKPKQSKLFR